MISSTHLSQNDSSTAQSSQPVIQLQFDVANLIKRKHRYISQFKSLPLTPIVKWMIYVGCVSLISACGGGGGSQSNVTPIPEPTLVTPSINKPVTDSAVKADLKREAATLAAQTVKDIRAHRSAESSFGVIAKDAPRLSQHKVTVNGNWSGMLATGMYAVPGEIVEVTVPSQLVGKSYMIRISGHEDDISENKEWLRMPSGIQRSFPITQATTQIASPYGGAIYIDLLDGADSKTPRAYGELSVTIHGAIEAPYFVLGKTSNAEWLSRIRQNPAPYAELVSNHVALSVPSSMIRQLDNPEELVKYWDDFVAIQDWVGGTEQYRTGPDRINFDVQISVGYLHAGYPIQGPYHVEASQNLLKLDVLRKEGEWGYFHEMGHEMQQQSHLWGGWYDGNGFTFEGGVEVTVNIFAKAAMDKMAPFASTGQGSGWGWAPYAGRVLSKAKLAINDTNKSSFDQKDQYPFYFSLADGFGWNVYRKVLSSYVNDAVNKTGAFPKTNQEKKDQWLIRWSTISGYDMVDYMVNRWKLDVSDDAIKRVHDLKLPTWLPATTSIDNFTIAANASKQLDLQNTGFHLTGKAEFVRVTAGKQHTISLNPDGSYTFMPKPGALGRDQFTVVYRSDAGNEVETIIQVEVQPAK